MSHRLKQKRICYSAKYANTFKQDYKQFNIPLFKHNLESKDQLWKRENLKVSISDPFRARKVCEIISNQKYARDTDFNYILCQVVNQYSVKCLHFSIKSDSSSAHERGSSVLPIKSFDTETCGFCVDLSSVTLLPNAYIRTL